MQLEKTQTKFLLLSISLLFETFEKPGISGGTRRPRFIGAMRRGQNSPMDTLLKRPTREPWNWKKAHRL